MLSNILVSSAVSLYEAQKRNRMDTARTWIKKKNFEVSDTIEIKYIAYTVSKRVIGIMEPNIISLKIQQEMLLVHYVSVMQNRKATLLRNCCPRQIDIRPDCS